ncbi:MAG: endonuclease, partial [Flavobacteriaceae bacterium]|nr:endonuclease [Flavobacteriaceae bacterium]
SYEQLDQKLQGIASNRQKLLNKIKGIEKEMKELYSAIEYQHTLSQNKLVYDMYLENIEDTAFYEEYKPQIIAYEVALKGLEKSEYQAAGMHTLAEQYAVLEQEKNMLMKEYTAENSMLHELQQAKKNTDIYLGNELEK